DLPADRRVSSARLISRPGEREPLPVRHRQGGRSNHWNQPQRKEAQDGNLGHERHDRGLGPRAEPLSRKRRTNLGASALHYLEGGMDGAGGGGDIRVAEQKHLAGGSLGEL